MQTSSNYWLSAETLFNLNLQKSIKEYATHKKAITLAEMLLHHIITNNREKNIILLSIESVFFFFFFPQFYTVEYILFVFSVHLTCWLLSYPDVEELSRNSLFLPVFCSWDNIHLRARRSPHHIYLATQWPAEHTGRPAGSGLQHTAEGGCSGQGGECQGTGRLPGAAHSKILYWGIWWGMKLLGELENTVKELSASWIRGESPQ